MGNQYIKVTDELPPAGVEVWCYNGETEFKNVHTGMDWKYQLKYPITHWAYKTPTPDMEEVVSIRELIDTL